jgi:hypothetical protein
MKFVGLVLLPALLQVIVGLVLMSLRKPGGEFVALGVMLLGLVAIPLTALANWVRTRATPQPPAIELLAKTLFTTLVFPALGLCLYVFAS